MIEEAFYIATMIILVGVALVAIYSGILAFSTGMIHSRKFRKIIGFSAVGFITLWILSIAVG